jgi:hypothetical protein
MLEYELKKQLDLANQQIALYELLVAILNREVANRDNLIKSQENLITMYATKDKMQDEVIKAINTPPLFPAPRFWGW